MKVLAVVLCLVGSAMSGFGLWRKKNQGGPVFFGDVSDSIKDLYGVSKPSNLPIIIGVFLLLIGILFAII